LKDAARLLAYLIGTVLLGCLLAPPLFWLAQAAATHGILPGLASFDFESFFHRALLVSGLILLWPLVKCGGTHIDELGLARRGNTTAHLIAGFLIACVPLLLCGAVLVILKFYSVRVALSLPSVGAVLGATIVVPLIEEVFFRGLILGLLLRSCPPLMANFISSALFALLHFLKGDDRTVQQINWSSGFLSLAHSFGQFSQPMLIIGALATLFLIGWILADARLRTKTLWLSIGLHAGWIFGNGIFNRLAHRRVLALPWLGRNLLIGLVPLGVCLLTWGIVILFLRRKSRRSQTC
jgi:membrane protease YdiL (CAAX protease family)